MVFKNVTHDNQGSRKTFMKSLNAEFYFVHYPSLNLCFHLQIYEPLTYKLRKIENKAGDDPAILCDTQPLIVFIYM